MSESSFERLSKFTPDAGRLQRDALLFAAGRCSARPGGVWMAVAFLLALSQTLSLVVLWPHPLPTRQAIKSIATVPGPTARSRGLSNNSLWLVRRNLPESELANGPGGVLNLIDTGPPLRAFPRPPSTLN
jgi:hypothetical protein